MKFTIANALTIIDKCKVESEKKMGTTSNNLCNSCTNVEAISKAESEARLKADMIAILTEIKLKITEKSYYDTTIIGNYEDEVRINLVELDDVNEIIIEKINELKERI